MKHKKPDWYNQRIEKPIREIVRLLRNNGVNTTCSCGHGMYIHYDFTIDGELKDRYDWVSHYLWEEGKNIDFTITETIQVIDGHPYPRGKIVINKKGDIIL